MTIDYSDITVVVQGPVQALPDRDQDEGVTKQCLASVRLHLPGARIILSTWENQDLDGLTFDELHINEDPGTNIREYKKDGRPVKMNNNRQIASSVGGLKQVKTKYALKLRSDNFLTGSEFVDIQKRFTKRSEDCRFFKERVVAVNTFTRQYHSGKRVAFHLSDFFHFGLTEDLLLLWDIPFLPDLAYSEENKGKAQNNGFPQINVDCTQSFWLAALSKTRSDVSIRYLYDCSSEKLELSNKYYANNLVIASPSELGVSVGDKFTNPARSKAGKRSGVVCFMTFREWQSLYRRHCDREYRVSGSFLEDVRLWFWRLLLVFPRRPETELKLLRRRIRGY